MRSSRVAVISRPKEIRIQNLLSDYGLAQIDQLKACTQKISRRLGGDRTKKVMACLDEGDLAGAADFILLYYDKGYGHGLGKRMSQDLHPIEAGEVSQKILADQLLEWANATFSVELCCTLFD